MLIFRKSTYRIPQVSIESLCITCLNHMFTRVKKAVNNIKVTHSDHTNISMRRKLAEDLLSIDALGVCREGIVAENCAKRVTLGHGADQLRRDFFIEAGEQGIIID